MRNRMKLMTALVLAMAGVAHAVPQALRLSLPPGTSYTFNSTMKTDMDLMVNANGQQMPMQQSQGRVMSGTIEVLESANGVPTKTKVTFGQDCGMSMSMMGQQQGRPFALAGRTVTVTVNGEAIDIVPADGVDEEVRSAVSELVVRQDGIYPDRPVDVGDTWQGNLGAAAGELQPKLTLKLERFDTVDGRSVAHLACQGEMNGVNNGMNIAGTLAGPLVLDIATGLPLEGSLAGDMKMNGNTTENGMPIQINGTGKMTFTGRHVIRGDAPRPFAPDVNPNPINPPNPVNPIGPDNPLGGAPALGGTYTGDGLTMTIAGDDIQLDLGGRKFAGKIARLDGSTVSGSFSHEGTTFDFKCVPNGNDIDFTTGTRTYKLKKQGGGNPLG